ncbi:MAG: hypothetical protein KDA86_18505 [Planctomycetaceae bacterium]|nr:hypothetical protein [Planctomycetaceae bacterium]
MELPFGLHVHVFHWHNSPYTSDGLNAAPFESSVDLYEQTEPITLPEQEVNQFDHLQLVSALVQITGCVDAENFASERARFREADSPPGVCADLSSCVMLI